jgi:endonuclease/exonuclease/phosphatase family metal-dependent hydrolase
MNFLAIILSAVIVGTWNGRWFPSGRAEHRAHAQVEAATISAAAKMLSGAINQMDPLGTNDIILCLNEIRDPLAASNLVTQIGRKDLAVAIITRYRRRDRFDMQQDVIATTLPVVDSHWSKWKNHREFTPPRGYAFASVVVGSAVTANVYAVHLKSNYAANTASKKELNREKRARAVSQLVAQEKPWRGKKATRPVIVAGDLNADCWRREFAEEKIFTLFEDAGFFNTLSLLPENKRGTYPSRRWGDSTLDYIMVRGFNTSSAPRIFIEDELSDHRAVFVMLELGR